MKMRALKRQYHAKIGRLTYLSLNLEDATLDAIRKLFNESGQRSFTLFLHDFVTAAMKQQSRNVLDSRKNRNRLVSHRDQTEENSSGMAFRSYDSVFIDDLAGPPVFKDVAFIDSDDIGVRIGGSEVDQEGAKEVD